MVSKKIFLCFAPLSVVRGYEEGGYKTPEHVVDRQGQVASVRQGKGDNGHTAHADQRHDGVEDKLEDDVGRSGVEDWRAEVERIVGLMKVSCWQRWQFDLSDWTHYSNYLQFDWEHVIFDG